MIRTTACAAIACLVASCAPPKGILVESGPVEGPVPGKPAVEKKEEVPPVPVLAQGNRMRTPSAEATRMPESKDFVPTAQTAGNAGAVIASPPGNRTEPVKPVNE